MANNKGAKVKKSNGEKGTAEGFTKFYFSGTPPEQFEHKPEVGEQRTMTVVVECKHSGNEGTDKGVVHQTKWKVVNAEIGSLKPRQEDPALPLFPEDEPQQPADEAPADPLPEGPEWGDAETETSQREDGRGDKIFSSAS